VHKSTRAALIPHPGKSQLWYGFVPSFGNYSPNRFGLCIPTEEQYLIMVSVWSWGRGYGNAMDDTSFVAFPFGCESVSGCLAVYQSNGNLVISIYL